MSRTPSYPASAFRDNHEDTKGAPETEIFAALRLSFEPFGTAARRNDSRGLDTENHHLSGLDEGGGGLAGFEIHFAGGTGGDDRGDLLAANGDFDFGHEAADAHAVDTAHELIAAADAADYVASFLLGLASGAVEQAVHLVLGNAMVATCGLHTADSLLVDPLFERGETNAKLHGGVAQVQ